MNADHFLPIKEAIKDHGYLYSKNVVTFDEVGRKIAVMRGDFDSNTLRVIAHWMELPQAKRLEIYAELHKQ